MSIVFCKLPKAGLGNQLFPLVKAHIMASLNGLPVVVTNYHQLKIGPYLRGEKTKRKYRNYFTFQKSILHDQRNRLKLKYSDKSKILHEATLGKYDSEKLTANSFLYDTIPHWSDFFKNLKEYRTLAIKHLDEILHPNIKKMVSNLPAPCIGVHIRMGDFRKLQAGQDFKSVGAVRTPEEYFIDVIEKIRSINGKSLPVSVFTDGHRDEFERLFDMPNVTMVEGNPDIVDLLMLSKSKIIVASANSTFSYWSGFLSDAPFIMHPDHVHESIRLKEDGPTLYEGPMDETNIQLINTIKSI